MTDKEIIERVKSFGIGYKRLNDVMKSSDNWGGMVHAFEYLTVLGIVEDALQADWEENNDG